MNIFLTVLAIILVIAIVALVALYFLGRNLEAKQASQQEAIEAHKQVISMLVIDKKKLRISESGLPALVSAQIPWYLKWSKVPVVKAKVGPKVMTLMTDEKVFQQMPVKAEVKVCISGIYITEIKSVRGGSIVKAPEKKGFLAGLKKRFSKQ